MFVVRFYVHIAHCIIRTKLIFTLMLVMMRALIVMLTRYAFALRKTLALTCVYRLSQGDKTNHVYDV